MKRTPLYANHLAAGGKMVEFAGYELPVQYSSGLMEEHKAVRERAGIFDVSHMGEFLISGPDAVKNLNRIMTNNFSKLKVGRMRYTLMCREDGGTLDDLIVARLAEDQFLLIVNAANTESDCDWIEQQLTGAVHFEDMTDDVGLTALQGPKAQTVLAKLTNPEDIPETPYSLTESIRLKAQGEGGPAVTGCTVSRTGYTGEDGFEIMCRAEDISDVWDLLLAAGEDEGLIPCGLGSRDSLRLEAGLPLYGHELDRTINPYEADLSFTVKPSDEHPFIGQQAILAKLPVKRIRVGLEITGRGIVREGAEVKHSGETIGRVTSGTFSPTLQKAVAMALIDVNQAEPGTELQCIVRGKAIPAAVIELPFYKRS